jgi:methyl-accepting chemotaxis protein
MPSKFKVRTIAHKLCLAVGTATGVILLATTWLCSFESQQSLERQADAKAMQMLQGTAVQLDTYVQRCGARTDAVAARQQLLGDKPDLNVPAYFAQLLKLTPKSDTFDYYIAYDKMNWKAKGANPLMTRNTAPGLVPVTYDYHNADQEWYHGAINAGGPYVCEPYYDDGGANASMVSYTRPIYDADHNVVAVTGVDLGFDVLNNIMSDVHILDHSNSSLEYAFLVSRGGTLITYPNPKFLLGKGFAGVPASSLSDAKAAAGQQGSATIKVKGEWRKIYWSTAPFTGWKIVMCVSRDAIFAPSIALRNKIMATSAVALLLMLGFVWLIAKKLEQALAPIARCADLLAQGDVDQTITAQSDDEIGRIAASFRSVIEYQKAMVDVANAIAAGDLTGDIQPLSKQDALGNTFHTMLKNLRVLIGEVRDSSDGVTSAATAVAGAAHEVGSSTEEISQTMREVAEASDQSAIGAADVTKRNAVQAKAVADGMKRLQRLTGDVDKVALDASAAADEAARADRVALEGVHTVEKTVKGMKSIHKTVEESSAIIHSLGDASKRIGSIVETIDAIAEQTNLLALNAAIEAARAGNSGRGFAVVADEVRKLAERSGVATREIGSLINEVQTRTAEAVKSMDAGRRDVEAGSALAEEAGKALSEIQSVVESVTSHARQIKESASQMRLTAGEVSSTIDEIAGSIEYNSAAAEEMSASAEEVSASIQTVAATTQQQTKSVEDLTDAAGNLEELAGSLHQTISRFVLDLEEEQTKRPNLKMVA